KNKEKVFAVFRLHNVSSLIGNIIFNAYTDNPFSDKKVLCHGDLHTGNFGYADDKTVVLDWEHCHLNTPYWDLYHLIDISHPDFPRESGRTLRNMILDCYCDVHAMPASVRKQFKRDYYLLSAVLSIWMILLIQSDLDNQNSKWTPEQLSRQLKETIRNLVECAGKISY